MDKRSIYIDSSDAKERQIAASYMVPTPVWKSSYRLIFDDKTEPTLEGWAIIDNTSGEDWTNVSLAVVSGRPVSFISKLYEPKYVPRQTVELPEDRAAAPVVYGGAVEQRRRIAAVAGSIRSCASGNGTCESHWLALQESGVGGISKMSATPYSATSR